MAIGTDSAIDFFGTQDTVTAGGGTSAVNDTAFSATADIVEWTNDDDAPRAVFVLKFQYPSGTIDANGIHLYARLKNIDSTNAEPVVDSGWAQHYLGTFVTDTGQAATTDTYYAIEADLLNTVSSQVYEFYLHNDCGVTMSAGWTLKVTPKTVGPHP